MIITVTLNAAIDRTLSVPNFRQGQRHRAIDSVALPGGKGVNVARALKTLGQPAIAMGFAGGFTGTTIVEGLTNEAILNDFVRIQEESRISAAVVDPTSGEQTEINERGPHIGERELELFIDKLLYVCKGAGVCVFAGSVPSGVPEDIYAQLVAELKSLSITTVVDCEGEPLRRALAVGPDVISPNLLEAEQLVGHEFNDEEDELAALKQICSLGARDVVITHDWGCYALVAGGRERRLFRVALEPLEPVSAVGSGDSFLAGYVASRYTGKPADECLRFGVACGAESTRHFGAGRLDPRAVERLMEEVEITALDAAMISRS